jgi:hypothetical protein
MSTMLSEQLWLGGNHGFKTVWEGLPVFESDNSTLGPAFRTAFGTVAKAYLTLLKSRGIAPMHRQIKLVDEPSWGKPHALVQCVTLFRFTKSLCEPYGGCGLRTSGTLPIPPVRAQTQIHDEQRATSNDNNIARLFVLLSAELVVAMSESNTDPFRCASISRVPRVIMQEVLAVLGPLDVWDVHADFLTPSAAAVASAGGLQLTVYNNAAALIDHPAMRARAFVWEQFQQRATSGSAGVIGDNACWDFTSRLFAGTDMAVLVSFDRKPQLVVGH